MKEIKPVTIATYQILTAKRKGEYAHLALLDALDWGLIVYDEVHLLPAPVFKLTAELQARRRLGLTATLVREDGREGDVFSLIGPKRFDAPWKEIEAQGFISPAACYEVRIDLPQSERLEYAAAADDERYRLAATAPGEARRRARARRQARRRAHPRDRPVPRPDRRARRGARRTEAHRCDARRRARAAVPGVPRRRARRCSWCRRSRTSRSTCPRPPSRSRCRARSAPARRRRSASVGCCARRSRALSANFYTLVARDTVDQDFAQNRQRFLAEQGYSYTILDAHALQAA